MSIRTELILALLVFAAFPMIAMGVLSFANARKSLKETRIAGLESTADLSVVYGDRQRIWEVLQNLVDNAIKFKGEEPNPRVEIGLWQNGKEPVRFVRDNGMGIDSRYNQKVFELFDQLDQKADGTGIELTSRAATATTAATRPESGGGG